jgi:hypothetical protein
MELGDVGRHGLHAFTMGLVDGANETIELALGDLHDSSW